MLEEDLLTFNGEAQFGERALVALVPEVCDNASDVLQREALTQLCCDQERVAPRRQATTDSRLATATACSWSGTARKTVSAAWRRPTSTSMCDRPCPRLSL
jgi:hypothetical protein